MSYQFQGQRPHEEVLLVTHQHPFTLLHASLWTVLILLLPVAVYALSPTGIILSVAVVTAIIVAFFTAYHSWYSWNRTLFLLTNERVVFLEQHGFFRRELVELPLKNIQQVSHEVTGILHTVFGFGRINLITPGSQQPVRIPNVPDPYAIQQEILQAQHGDGFIPEDPKPLEPAA